MDPRLKNIIDEYTGIIRGMDDDDMMLEASKYHMILFIAEMERLQAENARIKEEKTFQRDLLDTLAKVVTSYQDEAERLQHILSHDGQASYFRKYNRKAEQVAELQAENARLKTAGPCPECMVNLEGLESGIYDTPWAQVGKCPVCKGKGIVYERTQ